MTRHNPPSPIRVLTALSVVAVLMASLSACGGDQHGSPSSGARKFTVVLDWTPNTNHSGIYLAKANGWYRDAGLDVDVIQPGQSTSSTDLLAAGKADVAVAASEDIVAARSQGLPVQSIAAIIQHNTSSLVALRKSGIKGLADLPGHTYGGFGGPLEEALVKKFTACGGGDPAKVKFVTAGDADYRVGMTRGDYDFVWIFDGWDGIRYSQFDKLDITRIPFIAHTNCIPDWYTPVLATRDDLPADRKARVKAFMAATARGYRTAMTHPDQAASALIKAVPEIDAPLVRASAAYLAPRYADHPQRWGQQDAAVWERFATFVHTSGLAKKAIDARQAFTNDYLPSASG